MNFGYSYRFEMATILLTIPLRPFLAHINFECDSSRLRSTKERPDFDCSARSSNFYLPIFVVVLSPLFRRYCCWHGYYYSLCPTHSVNLCLANNFQDEIIRFLFMRRSLWDFFPFRLFVSFRLASKLYFLLFELFSDERNDFQQCLQFGNDCAHVCLCKHSVQWREQVVNVWFRMTRIDGICRTCIHQFRFDMSRVQSFPFTFFTRLISA